MIKQIIVTGATNQIAHFLLPRLPVQTAIAISRQAPPPNLPPNLQWWQYTLTDELPDLPKLLPIPTALIHLAPLRYTPPLIASICEKIPLKRVIAFSSTSRFTKQQSANAKERAVVEALIEGEEAIIQHCEAAQIPWIILRPTLVYGCNKDKNIYFIQQFIQKFGFFPLFGAAQGLRQPVHAEDLAQACLQILENAKTYGHSYNLSGGETLSYREMVERVFIHLNRNPRYFTIPFPIFKFAIASLRWIPRFSHINSAMAERMNQDLCFDHQAATKDFAYQPRVFVPSSENS